MSVKVGMDGSVYLNVGTFGSPVYEEILLAKDVTTTLEKGMADLSSRGSGGHRWHRRTLKDMSPEIVMIWDGANAVALAILAAFLDDETVDLLFLDGDLATAGSTGPRALFEVASFPRAEQLEEGMTVSCKFALAYGSVPFIVTI